MTREDREDAIDIIQSILDKYEEDECLVTEITIGDEDIKAFKMAIKALEKESILDEIRADIISYEGDCRLSVDEYPSCKQCTDNVFESIYAILDKCKAESEKTI